MPHLSMSTPVSKRPLKLVWALTLFLVLIGLAAVARRACVLANPEPQISGRAQVW